MEYPLLLEMSQMLASRVFLVSFDFHCCTTGNSYSYVSTVTSTPPVLEVMDMFTCVDYEFFTVVFPKRDILDLTIMRLLAILKILS